MCAENLIVDAGHSSLHSITFEDLCFHGFGGGWTAIKLEVLNRYLESYNIALQHKPTVRNPFKRIFIDAFAGTGECAIKLDGKTVRINGSAKLALELSPGFDDHFFVDIKSSHIDALNKLVEDFPNKKVQVMAGDGNELVEQLVKSINWRKSRAVMLLDPYGMAVKWETLQKIASTQAIDLWYLFPLSAVCRQAANDYSKVDSGKQNALTRLFGTGDWEKAFYQEVGQGDLFSLDNSRHDIRRNANVDGILAYMQGRLKTVFPIVLDPIKLPNDGPALFGLFFISSNPHKKAADLSKRIAGYILNMQASGKLRSLPSRLDPKFDVKDLL
jgi:three-Cys-motif partner protein